jgi:hypothetical protein
MKGTISNRVLLGSIEVLRKGEQVEIIQSTQKNYLIRKIGLFEVFSINKDNLTLCNNERVA